MCYLNKTCLFYFRKILILVIFTLFHIHFNSYAQAPVNPGTGSNNSSYRKLMDFDHTNNGSNPQKIIITGDLLYGICFEGGANDDGLLFKINTDGSDFQKVDLYGQYGSGPTSLAISNNVLYGATISGGDYDDGVLFKIDANGYKIFHHFNHDATIPLLYDILVSQNMVYGIAWDPYWGNGMVFRVNVFGLGFKTLASLDNWPRRGLLLHDNYLYGVTNGGYGSSGSPGILYKIKSDGSEFYTLHQFENMEDGLRPASNLVMIDDTLYGTTSAGGTYNFGVIYKIPIDGTSYEKLADYPPDDENDQTGCSIYHLAHSDSSLYGSDGSGGIQNLGALVRMNYSTGIKKMMEFKDSNDGVYPGSFVISDDVIYGIAGYGGGFGKGVLYKYELNKTTENPYENLEKIKLLFTLPEQVVIDTKENLLVEKGSYINLDTTFTVTGNTAYTHSWQVKSGSGYNIVNSEVQINGDSTFYLFLTTIEACTYVDSVVIQTQPTGIFGKKESDRSINIFPNPNMGDFLLKVPYGHDSYSFEIIDFFGKKVMEGNLISPVENGIHNVVVNDVMPGIYILVVKKKNLIVSRQKFIISR